MIGASKMDEILDIPRLREMISQETNNHRVSEKFRTINGEQISPEMVRAVRKGKRWNTDTRSFLMKTEMEQEIKQPMTKSKKNKMETILKDDVFGEAQIVSTYEVVGGVGIVVNTYWDWNGSENSVVLCDHITELAPQHFDYLSEMTLKHKMCRDLIIIEALFAE